MTKSLSHARIAQAIILALAIGQGTGCSESIETRNARIEKEREAHIEFERSKFVARYPDSKNFDDIDPADARRFSIDLQRAVQKNPDQTYWLKTISFDPDVVARSKGIRVEFGDHSDKFSLSCSEEVLSELEKERDKLLYGTFLLAFKISGVQSLHIELRGDNSDEPDIDEIPVVAANVNAWLFSGTLLEVQRVSEIEQK